MFGIPGEILWPTAAFATLISLIFAGVAVLRFLPQPKSRGGERPEVLADLRARLDQLDRLQERLGELEERVDFAERLLTNRREGERVAPPGPG